MFNQNLGVSVKPLQKLNFNLCKRWKSWQKKGPNWSSIRSPIQRELQNTIRRAQRTLTRCHCTSHNPYVPMFEVIFVWIYILWHKFAAWPVANINPPAFFSFGSRTFFGNTILGLKKVQKFFCTSFYLKIVPKDFKTHDESPSFRMKLCRGDLDKIKREEVVTLIYETKFHKSNKMAESLWRHTYKSSRKKCKNEQPTPPLHRLLRNN